MRRSLRTHTRHDPGKLLRFLPLVNIPLDPTFHVHDFDAYRLQSR
jgi:hypothetical protein